MNKLLLVMLAAAVASSTVFAARDPGLKLKVLKPKGLTSVSDEAFKGQSAVLQQMRDQKLTGFFAQNPDVVYCAHRRLPVRTQIFHEHPILKKGIIHFSYPSEKEPTRGTVLLNDDAQQKLEEILAKEPSPALTSRALAPTQDMPAPRSLTATSIFAPPENTVAVVDLVSAKPKRSRWDMKRSDANVGSLLSYQSAIVDTRGEESPKPTSAIAPPFTLPPSALVSIAEQAGNTARSTGLPTLPSLPSLPGSQASGDDALPGTSPAHERTPSVIFTGAGLDQRLTPAVSDTPVSASDVLSSPARLERTLTDSLDTGLGSSEDPSNATTPRISEDDETRGDQNTLAVDPAGDDAKDASATPKAEEEQTLAMVVTPAVVAAVLNTDQAQDAAANLVAKLEAAAQGDGSVGAGVVTPTSVTESVDALTQASQVGSVVAAAAQVIQSDGAKSASRCQRFIAIFKCKDKSMSKKQKIALGVAGMITFIAVLKYFQNPYYMVLEEMLFAKIIDPAMAGALPLVRNYIPVFEGVINGLCARRSIINGTVDSTALQACLALMMPSVQAAA